LWLPACNATTEHVIIHLSKFPLYELGNYNMVFEVELELTIDEEDGATVVQKMSELVNKAKELGFVIVEAEAEQEEEEEDEEESDKYEKKEE
jgi:hypothetical protein